MQFEASTLIKAPAEHIWAVVTDGAQWPAFDPTCERIEGTMAAGATLKAFSTLSPGRAFPVKVTGFEPPTRMVWTGGMPFGLFKGVRTFTLLPEGDGMRVIVNETFSGLLLGLFRKQIPDMTGPFQGFVDGLRDRCEGDGPAA